MTRSRISTAAFIACVSVTTSISPALAQDAPSIFKNKCAACHATDGSGKTGAGKKMETPDLRAKEFVEMSDKDMFESIGRGTKHRNYPHSYLYTGLNESQVRSLVTYIRGLQQKK